MAKLQFAPPPHWQPAREKRGFYIGRQPHGAAPGVPAQIAVLRKLTSHRALGPTADYDYWLKTTGISLPGYRRNWGRGLAFAWKTDLSNAQRTAWRNMAATVSITNCKAVSKTPSGYQLFHHYNDFAAHAIGYWPPYDAGEFAVPIPDPPAAWDPPPAPHITSFFSAGGGHLYIYTDNLPSGQNLYSPAVWRPAPDSHPTKRPGQYRTAQMFSVGGTPPVCVFNLSFSNVPGYQRLPLWITCGVRYLSQPNLVPGPLSWATAYVTY